MNKNYDIVIIGGGVAGALLAYKLSAKLKNKKIVILEAGTDRTAERTQMSLAFASSIIKSPISPYDKNPEILLKSPGSTDDYFTYQPESLKFKSTYLRTGGGTTWHWLGNVPRHLPNDFKLFSTYGKGVDWPIGYEDIEAYYSEAETELGVSGDHADWNNIVDGAFRSKEFPMPKIWPSYLEKVIKNGVDGLEVEGKKIKIRSTPQARNSQAYQGRPACAGNSSCVPICPIQAKYDATVHLKKATENGVEIKYKAIVQNIEKNSDGKIVRIHFKNWEHDSDYVEGKLFILAANAIESSILLQYSNIANSSGKVGKYLMDHPQGYGVGVSNEPLYTFRGPPTTSGIDEFRDGDFRKQSAAFRISVGNDGWSRFTRRDNPRGIENLEFLIEEKFGKEDFMIGKKLKEAIEQKVIRIFRFSYSTEMLPVESNRVELDMNNKDEISGLPRPKINFKIDVNDQYNNDAFKMAKNVLTKMFEHLRIANTDFEVQESNSVFSGAGHIMGTLRMGNNPADSVVDRNCKTHDHSNLFIAGSGLFPTSGTANPTITIAALALRLADEIERKFKENDLCD